ncbi:MAG: hypothetical protein A3D31_16655 [Candidatus Fluviicola riflensis]|nr:MAG: hypothetical protein CHH17_01595 [Candidatus Fluviicola riflensis]OGS76627.1 MAG: hypothetical protein A3D31_16655 [Candidatus Fluviicola riflensis]OGS83018.1 MAG: hypothetical protein A2724_14705 [Fluviicola sp. RIFCSPHIGHO2_01_FULL_43_53]OGS88358.1 MAG: hypothetical protein A3E30_06160 [Fluviicola sp. RIFCSPHIGHO2_12_FULL_43_24]
MKKPCYLLVCLCSATISFGQTTETKQINTQSNGVVVHESAGNEGFYNAQPQAVVVRTIQDWTLPECIDALTVIQEKLIMLEGSAEYETVRVTILEQQALIEARKQSLLSNQ